MKDFFKSLKSIGLEFTDGDDLLPKARVKNDPKQVRTYDIPFPLSLEEQEKRRKNEEKILLKRASNFTNGINIYENFQYVDIDLMIPCAPNWAFNKPNQEQLITLISSIETMGVLSPFILVKDKRSTDYTIVCGHSRHVALKNLYANTQDNKYKFAPCFVLDYDEVDEYFVRALIIDSNLSYRTMDQTILMRALFERYEILKRTKSFRSESDIGRALADEFLISRSTVFNYLCLKKLREEVMVLLLEKRITLQAARYLARVNHDVQLMILENFGIENINIKHRIKYLTSKDNVKLPELLKRIEVANGLVPHKTTVNVTVAKHLVPKLFDVLGEFKDYSVINYQYVFNTKNANKYCNIVYDEEHVKFYLEKEILNKKAVDLVNVKNQEELSKAKKG